MLIYLHLKYIIFFQQNDRVQIQIQHGFVVLSINEAQLSDAGIYQIIATNERGTAETTATILVHPRADILKENQRYDVEDVRDIQFSVSKGQKSAPQFLNELGRSYFEARIQPVNDPTLRVQWLKDGLPLNNANRIQTFHNFGFVSLTLHPTYPEDNGVYTCVLINDLGEAQSSAQLTTISTETLQLDPLHEDSLQQINAIEGHEIHIGYVALDILYAYPEDSGTFTMIAKNELGEAQRHEIHIGPILHERPEEFHSLEAPKVVRPLASKIEVEENEPIHFEARIQPASDVKMTVEWFHNGAPLPAAHRFRPMFDFGYVALDILYAYPEDS
uniref:Ig-like domain-containing protein n=1 Tax=Panagrolaimus sp. ES5 TaxID=591445 RepID=A0AC34G866_9BILA